MFHEALELWEKGFSVVPLATQSKQPEKGFSLKPYFTQRPTLGNIRQWFGMETRHNIGLICGQISRIAVVDADNLDDARELYRRLPKTDMMTRTPNGVHFYYQTEKEIRPKIKTLIMGIRADIRAEDSYVVAPPSIHPSGETYERLGDWNLVDVPEFQESWIEERKPKKRNGVGKLEAWLMQIDSVQGQGGNRGLVRFVTRCRDEGLSQARCMELLMRWNQSPKVQPAWSSDELIRAVENLYGG